MEPARTSSSNRFQTIARAVGLALAFFVADAALNRFAFSDGWTILWPLNGFTIILLMRNPRSRWPILLLSIEIGVALGEFRDHNGPFSELIQRLISVIEVVISALLLPRFTTLETWLREPRIVQRFIAALLLGPAVSGICAAIYFHLSTRQPYVSAFDDWAAADALGIAAFVPLALSIDSVEMRQLFTRRTVAKTAGVLLFSLASTSVVFAVGRYPLVFLLFPALLVVDSVLGFSGSAIAMAATSLVAVFFTTHGAGPFGQWPHNLAVSRDVAFQLFLGFHLVALFPPSILFMEKRRLANELRASNQQLLLLASVDALTGIDNRRSLDQHILQEWSRAARQQTSLALIMVDIDFFKQFNDAYGHIAGDHCLQVVASVLKSEVRRVEDQLARFGGEEFAVLLPHTDLEGAMCLAENLRLAVLKQHLTHRGSPLHQVSISLGCAAVTPLPGQQSESLLDLADKALYKAKHAGRNQARSSCTADRLVPHLGLVARQGMEERSAASLLQRSSSF